MITSYKIFTYSAEFVVLHRKIETVFGYRLNWEWKSRELIAFNQHSHLVGGTGKACSVSYRNRIWIFSGTQVSVVQGCNLETQVVTLPEIAINFKIPKISSFYMSRFALLIR